MRLKVARPVSARSPTPRLKVAQEEHPTAKASYSTTPNSYLFTNAENKSAGGRAVVHQVGKGQAPLVNYGINWIRLGKAAMIQKSAQRGTA